MLASTSDYHFADLDEDHLVRGNSLASLVVFRMCSCLLDVGIDWGLVFQIEKCSVHKME